MPFPVAFQVASTGTPSFVDGTTTQQPLVDRYGNQRISQFRGKYGEANSRGQVYHFCQLAAGDTLPIFTATAQKYAIVNPAGSNVVLELIRLDIGFISTVQAPGNIVLCQNTVPGSAIVSGSLQATAATRTFGQSGQYGGLAPQSKCQMLTTITAIAPTVILRTFGYSQETALGTSTNNNLLQSIPFDGTDLIYPNSIIYVACTVAAGIGVDIINMTAMEIPWTNN